MSQQQKTITINSRKFDGKIHRSWKADFVKQKDSLIVFVGEFDHEINHAHLGIIRRGTVSHEFYWLDRMYNIFRFHEPDGGLRNFYCNVNLPPTFENGVLDYVDLDIDVLVWTDFTFEILDLDEFKENTTSYNYSSDLVTKALANLAELIYLIENRKFPFNLAV